MKKTGIIVEYNPFHQGHKYHIEKSIKKTKSKYIIAVMSGHFTQRGMPAICDKWKRAKMAIANGVDLLIELPLVYAIRSAESFASGAIQLLDKTEIIDNVVFGSELGEIDTLKKVAKLLISDNNYFANRLKKYLAEGNPYPDARNKALIDLIKIEKNNEDFTNLNLFEILTGSNNILAIEYLKAKYKNNLNLDLKTIKRIGEGYHSKNLNTNIISATAIRQSIYNNEIEKIKDTIPNPSYQLLKDEIKKDKIPINIDNLGILLISKIRSLPANKLGTYLDINHNLAQRIKTAADQSGNYKQLLYNLNTRSYTKTRFQRLLLNILFNLDKTYINKIDSKGPQYIRILGFSENGQKLLKEIKEKSSLPVIVSPKEYLNEVDINTTDLFKRTLSLDIFATDIYTILYKDPSFRRANLDYTENIIKNS